MKKMLILGATILSLAAFGSAAMAEDLPDMPDGPIKMEMTSKPVTFDHAVHASGSCTPCHQSVPKHFPPMQIAQESNCLVCHHLVDDELPPSFMCSDCHSELDRRDKTEYSYFRIAHGRDFASAERVSCLSCHLDVIKTRPEMRRELTSCVGSACHPKS